MVGGNKELTPLYRRISIVDKVSYTVSGKRAHRILLLSDGQNKIYQDEVRGQYIKDNARYLLGFEKQLANIGEAREQLEKRDPYYQDFAKTNYVKGMQEKLESPNKKSFVLESVMHGFSTAHEYLEQIWLEQLFKKIKSQEKPNNQ